MRMKIACPCVALVLVAAVVARADDSDLESAVQQMVYRTPTNNPRGRFQSSTRERQASDTFSWDVDVTSDWTRARTRMSAAGFTRRTTDRDVEGNVTLTGTIDPRADEYRLDPTAGGMALEISLSANVGQDDRGAASATRDDVSLGARLKKDYGKLEAEIGVDYDAPP